MKPGVVRLLDEPSVDVYAAGSLHPAAAYTLYTTIRAEYDQRVRAQMLLLNACARQRQRRVSESFE